MADFTLQPRAKSVDAGGLFKLMRRDKSANTDLVAQAGAPQSGIRADYLLRRAGGGVANLAGLPFDLANLAGETTGLWDARDGGSAQIKEGFKGLTGVDLAEAPRNDQERYAGAVAEFAGSSVIPAAGMAARAGQGIKAALATDAGISALGGVGQEAARDIDPENPWAPVIGAGAGMLSPFAATQTLRGVRGVARGGASDFFRADPNKAGAQAQRASQAFDATGITPTAAQIAPGRGVARVAERLVSWLPGGSGRYSDVLNTQTQKAAEFVERALEKAAGQLPDKMAIGQAVKTGADKFATRTSDVGSKLFDDVAKHIPNATIVAPTATRSALNELEQMGGAIPEFQEFAKSGIVKEISDMIAAAEKRGGADYRGLKDVRSKIGRLGENVFAQTASDADGATLKMLYGALSDDMATAATNAGPQAEQAFKLANKYWSARQNRIKEILDPVTSGKTAEEATAAFQRLSGTRARQVMQSLEPSQRLTVAGQMLAALGRSKSGVQNEVGNAFSFSEFATNYDKLRQSGALNAIFGTKQTAPLRSAIDNLNTVSNQVKQAGKFLPNASGSGQSIAATSTIATAATAAATGNIPTAAAIIGSMYIAPSLAARLLTSQRFVKWMGDLPKAGRKQWPGHLARLGSIIQNEPEIANDVKEFIQNIPDAFQQGDNLDKAAMLSAPIPLVGDVAGVANDARHYAMGDLAPTWGNIAMSMLGVLPGVPAVGGALAKTAERSGRAVWPIKTLSGKIIEMPVHTNPSLFSLEKLLKEAPHGDVRLLRNPANGSILVWPANEAMHIDIADTMDLPFKTRQELQKNSYLISAKDAMPILSDKAATSIPDLLAKIDKGYVSAKPVTKEASSAVRNSPSEGLTAYHGSPHTMDKIGDYVGSHKAPGQHYGTSADNLDAAFPGIYDNGALRIYGTGGANDAAAISLIKAMKNNPDMIVKVYRAVPRASNGNINAGDWVTPHASYAKTHGEGALGGDYKIVSQNIPVSSLYNDGNSIMEWGYNPKNAKGALPLAAQLDGKSQK